MFAFYKRTDRLWSLPSVLFNAYQKLLPLGVILSTYLQQPRRLTISGVMLLLPAYAFMSSTAMT